MFPMFLLQDYYAEAGLLLVRKLLGILKSNSSLSEPR